MAAEVHTIIKFDGPALAGKSMDVAQLAPSLLALSDLVKDANRLANGDRAAIRVLVNADLAQRCFELNVELVQTIWETVKLLIADDRVRSAKEIAEWLGLIGGPTVGLFVLIRRLKGKKAQSVAVLRVGEGDNLIEIRIEGEADPIVVSEAVYTLYANTKTRQKAIAVLNPLRTEGYDTLEFREDGGVFVHFDKEDVPAPDGSDLPEVVPQNERKSAIRTNVKIRKAAYEGTSKWTLVYHKAMEVGFDDLEWLARFQSGQESAPPGSYLDVDLEETYVTGETGDIIGEPTYRVKKVHRVVPPVEQDFFKFEDRPPPSGSEP